jgi:hypothetical protein
MDLSKQIETFEDGVIGIRITKENKHNISAIFEALKNAPTPKKPDNKPEFIEGDFKNALLD